MKVRMLQEMSFLTLILHRSVQILMLHIIILKTMLLQQAVAAIGFCWGGAQTFRYTLTMKIFLRHMFFMALHQMMLKLFLKFKHLFLTIMVGKITGLMQLLKELRVNSKMPIFPLNIKFMKEPDMPL